MSGPDLQAPDTLAERASRIRLVLLDVDGVLSDGRIVLGEHEELKRFHARDGFGITLLRASGLEVGILTGRRSGAVTRRAVELHLDHLIQGRPDKLAAFGELCSDRGFTSEQVCYMGDDWLDLPLLERVGLAAAPGDASPEVLSRVQLVTRAAGGCGAVRELAETLLQARGQYDTLLETYRRGEGEAASAQQSH